jgi:hypothetical protein
VAINSQVDAATVSAGAFFAERRLLVPDYQRKYSWLPDQQILEFWQDLSRAIGQGEYFLGLLVLSNGDDRDEIVDGQQRLVTLTILANELRLIALRLARRLVAESIRTNFLESMNFETEEQAPRVLLTDAGDRDDLRALLDASDQNAVQIRQGSAIHAARGKLASALDADVNGHAQPALRVGQWADFLTKSLTFAVFTHPNRSAAFRVYEVINTRGKELTPTELIKSHLIGSSETSTRDRTYQRWNSIEAQLDAIGAADQLTTFVRHVVTLERGYVIPRELYQEVSSAYAGPPGVERLLCLLESFLPIYLQLIDPSADVESSEERTKSFAIMETLAATRFRPILLAAAVSGADDNLLELLNIIVPGVITGLFGSGSYEAQFARAARRVHQSSDWDGELTRLRPLRPTIDEFVLRLSRGLNKAQALVIRSAYLRQSSLPDLVGYPHQVRPRNGENWRGFDDEQYRDVGGLVANWVLLTSERRPQGTRTPASVQEKLVPQLLSVEQRPQLDEWTAAKVAAESTRIGTEIARLWYGTE